MLNLSIPDVDTVNKVKLKRFSLNNYHQKREYIDRTDPTVTNVFIEFSLYIVYKFEIVPVSSCDWQTVWHMTALILDLTEVSGKKKFTVPSTKNEKKNPLK